MNAGSKPSLSASNSSTPKGNASAFAVFLLQALLRSGKSIRGERGWGGSPATVYCGRKQKKPLGRMKKSGIIGGVLAALLVGGAAAAFAVAWRPAISTLDLAAPQTFDAALIKHGRELAALGNCNNCHTVRGGKDFAGGLPVPTPFGTIYSSNITPDAETGIGRWSEQAFQRAMRSGVDREGRHLYPTFPYDHFTNVSDDDDRALYAYLMTRSAVRASDRANDLAFPFNQRFVVAGWKLLFLRGGTYRADNTQSAEWNRGAYLVEGLAHCGAC